MNKAVFLDRDGTINIDKGYTHKIEDLKFEQGALNGLKLLQTLNYKLIIVTGQSGIGRGYYTEQDYHRFMQHMYSELRKYKIIINKDYFCPHHPDYHCNCRKPKIGLLEQAVVDFDIDLSQSWVIDDKTDGIEMGRRAGCKTILVKTGKAGQDRHFNVKPDYTAENLYKAARIIANNT